MTCVVYWASWCAFSEIYIEALKDLYNSYASKGFGLIALSEDDLDTITSYTTSNNIPGHICQLTERFDDYSDGTNRVKYLPTYMLGTPAYAIVDSEGKIVFSESIYEFDDPTTCRVETTIAFMEEYFGEPMGESEEEDDTDYSKDGEVITLQTATQGSGIDLVIVGDGFIDTDMESGGVYETRMKEAMEHFFSEEPYTTYRDRFNVYTVKAVSEQSGVNGVNDTAFSSWFGDGTLIGGDDTKVFEYAMKVPSINSTDDLTVITVLNSSAYAGTCYMYTNGASVGYCPIVSYNDEQFRQIIVHEVGGHGFAKLLDEYAYEGTIPDEEIEAFKTQKSWGWGANVDVTDDEDEIQWAHLLADYRYSGLVDIYEGALTYAYGAYRPTDVSIMRYNTGGFNPPSREAIYKHIMELSGSTYSYENFVSYDAINRSVSSQAYSAKQALSVSKSTFVPLANPVVISGSPQISK